MDWYVDVSMARRTEDGADGDTSYKHELSVSCTFSKGSATEILLTRGEGTDDAEY